MMARLLMTAATFALILLVTVALGCTPMSEQRIDDAAGRNGGFEIVERDLPVNWLVYSPRTVPDATFTVNLDEEVVAEGDRSLRFDVAACTGARGWHGPGIAAEYAVAPGTTQRIRCRLRSDGSSWVVSSGGVAAKTGDCVVIARGGDTDGQWQIIETDVVIDEAFRRIRFEMNVLSPGTLWIDAVSVTPVSE